MNAEQHMATNNFRTVEQMSEIYAELSDEGKEQQPYILEYEAEGQKLIFFGSIHTADPEHMQTSLLDRKWHEFINFDGPHKHVLSEGNLRPVEGKNKIQAIKSDAESGHICWLAAKDNVPITSPEPSRENEINYLRNNGFSHEEIITYYFARQMLQWISYDHINEPNWKEYAKNIELYASVHDWGSMNLSLSSVLKTYKEQTGRDFSKDDREGLYKLSDPSQSPVSAASGRYRDEALYNVIKNKWQEGHSLFVVYGSGHAIVLEPALEVLAKEEND